MPFQKLEEGDPFEREFAEWIRTHLGDYEAIWSKYIGNDGTSHALEIRGLTIEQEAMRVRFSQAHYSLALFMFLLDLCSRFTTSARSALPEVSANTPTEESMSAI